MINLTFTLIEMLMLKSPNIFTKLAVWVVNYLITSMYQFVIVHFIKFNWKNNCNLLFVLRRFLSRSYLTAIHLSKEWEKKFFSQAIINSLFLPLEMETGYADLWIERCHITGQNLYTNCYMYIMMLLDRFYLFL